MQGDHSRALAAAYTLRHRLRSLGAVCDAAGRYGALVTPRHAAFILSVDESRVRRLIAAERVAVVELMGGFRYIPVGELWSAPTPCEAGRPLVRYPDGSVRRDDGGHDGLRLPLPITPGFVASRQKNGRSAPGRNV